MRDFKTFHNNSYAPDALLTDVRHNPSRAHLSAACVLSRATCTRSPSPVGLWPDDVARTVMSGAGLSIGAALGLRRVRIDGWGCSTSGYTRLRLPQRPGRINLSSRRTCRALATMTTSNTSETVATFIGAYAGPSTASCVRHRKPYRACCFTTGATEGTLRRICRHWQRVTLVSSLCRPLSQVP
jgi:hypothetical protein